MTRTQHSEFIAAHGFAAAAVPNEMNQHHFDQSNSSSDSNSGDISSDDSGIITLAKALEYSNEPKVICNAMTPCVVIHANRAWTLLTLYEQHEVLNQTLRKLQGPLTDREVIKKMMRTLKGTGYAVAQVVNYRKDGEPYWCTIEVQPVITVDEFGNQVLSHYLGMIQRLDGVIEQHQQAFEGDDDPQRTARTQSYHHIDPGGSYNSGPRIAQQEQHLHQCNIQPAQDQHIPEEFPIGYAWLLSDSSNIGVISDVSGSSSSHNNNPSPSTGATRNFVDVLQAPHEVRAFQQPQCASNEQSSRGKQKRNIKEVVGNEEASSRNKRKKSKK